MTSEPTTAPRVLEFFAAAPQPSPAPQPGEPPYGPLQMTYRSDADREAFESAAPEFLSNTQSAFVGFPECALNLVVLEFAPGFLLPLHSHQADCLYYIERGSILMGSRELGPGEGFLARANQAYGYMAGPKGARVIEFRSGFTFDFTLHERNVAGWKRRFLKSVA